jgi:8-oxo-dGTP pyrophosphatase MutT (NUDIX family)
MKHPMDNLAYRFPVSIKGVLAIDGRAALLRNEREEWELPGGKLELGETPEQCCARELDEELHVAARVERLVDSWVYTIAPDVHVLIVTYGCTADDTSTMRVSHEHKQLALFAPSELERLDMPTGYKRSIIAWLGRNGRIHA